MDDSQSEFTATFGKWYLSNYISITYPLRIHYLSYSKIEFIEKILGVWFKIFAQNPGLEEKETTL